VTAFSEANKIGEEEKKEGMHGLSEEFKFVTIF
jgi:hypothetical protein